MYTVMLSISLRTNRPGTFQYEMEIEGRYVYFSDGSAEVIKLTNAEWLQVKKNHLIDQVPNLR